MNLKRIRKSKAFKQVLQGLFILGSFYFLGVSMVENWNEIREVMTGLEWGLFIWALLSLVVSFTPRPLGMYFFLRGSPQRISFLQSGRAYFLSQLTKYLPGGVWVFPSRVVLLMESGVEVGMSSLGLAYESIAMVISSACVSLLATGLVTGQEAWNPQILFLASGVSVLGVIFILVGPEIVKKLTPGLFSKIRFLVSMETVPIRKRFVNLTLATVSYTIMWIMTGLSFYLLILALGVGGDAISASISVGVFSLSWLIGFLSVFNPGGIGLREAAILIFLGAALPAPIPILVALLSRVSWSLVEVFYFAAFSLFVRPVPSSAAGRA